MNDVAEWRRAEAKDAIAIRELTRAAYAKWVEVIGREPMPMVADYSAALREHLFDLIYLRGTLAGLIETHVGLDHLLIINIAVAPDFQNRGLGKMLMAYAEAQAVALRFSEIKLYTNQRFTENIQFYARLGYTVEREEPMNGGVAVHMRKVLTGP